MASRREPGTRLDSSPSASARLPDGRLLTRSLTVDLGRALRPRASLRRSHSSAPVRHAGTSATQPPGAVSKRNFPNRQYRDRTFHLIAWAGFNKLPVIANSPPSSGLRPRRPRGARLGILDASGRIEPGRSTERLPGGGNHPRRAGAAVDKYLDPRVSVRHSSTSKNLTMILIRPVAPTVARTLLMSNGVSVSSGSRSA